MEIQKGDWVLFNTRKYIVLWVYTSGYLEIKECHNERNIEVASIKEISKVIKKEPPQGKGSVIYTISDA